MANINMTTSGTATALPYSAGQGCKKLKKRIDFATVLATKGSALAAADIIQVMDLPIKCAIIAANIHGVTAVNASVCTLDLGFTSTPEADPDNFVDGFDATQIATDGVPIFSVQGYITTATTLDLEIKTLTGTLSTGVVDIVAIVLDLI